MNINNCILKTFICLFFVLGYSSQSHSISFNFSSLFGTKKKSQHNESCDFHIQNSTFLFRADTTLIAPAVLNINFIQDYDGDGIPDKYDDCPASFGLASLKGCPPIDLTKTITYGNPSVKLKDSDFNLMVDIFNSLNFEGDNQLLCKNSKNQLNKLVTFLKKEKKLYIYISSYVDIDKNRMLNYLLSEMRASEIQKYLVNKGIARNRVSVMHFGDNMPVISLPLTRFEVEICDKMKK